MRAARRAPKQLPARRRAVQSLEDSFAQETETRQAVLAARLRALGGLQASLDELKLEVRAIKTRCFLSFEILVVFLFTLLQICCFSVCSVVLKDVPNPPQLKNDMAQLEMKAMQLLRPTSSTLPEGWDAFYGRPLRTYYMARVPRLRPAPLLCYYPRPSCTLLSCD